MIKIKEALATVSPANVLDLCTGKGQFMQLLNEVLPGDVEMTGTDTDKNSLDEAARNIPGARFLLMPAEKLDFPGNSFDCVSVSRGLHHLEDVSVVIKEVRRVLKDRGWFVVNEMYSDKQDNQQVTSVLFHHLRVDLDKYFGIVHNYTFTREELISFFNINYWEILKIIDYIPEEEKDIPGMIENYKETISRINDNEQKQEFTLRLNELTDRVNRVGFRNPSTLLVIARKN